jgi:hypothetical protein
VLLAFQFPISDARPFGPNPTSRVDHPHWPKPDTKIRPEFVHFFGKAVERRRGADEAWTDETVFCLATRALRFADLANQGLGSRLTRFRPAAAFRRLFSDGNSVARLELGITHNRSRGRMNPVDAAAILQIAKDACMLPTWVPLGESSAARWRPLLRQGKDVASLYAAATQKRKIGKDAGTLDLVCAGEPLLLIECPRAHTIDPPAGFVDVPPEKTRGVRASFGRLQTDAGVVDTWLLQPGTSDRRDLRSFRLCLMRLHAEQSCLDQVLHHVRAKKIPNRSDGESVGDLYDALNRATRLVSRERWSGVSQSAILEAMDAALDVTPSTDRLLMAERFDTARAGVWRKLEDYQARRSAIRLVDVINVQEGATYVEKNVSVSGQGNIVNVADIISNVNNTVTQNLSNSAASDDVQKLVKELAAQLEQISGKIDPAKTAKMGKNITRLSEEVAAQEPERAWYEVSLKGLKEAAEAVGELGAPIAATVKKLWPLLLG